MCNNHYDVNNDDFDDYDMSTNDYDDQYDDDKILYMITVAVSKVNAVGHWHNLDHHYDCCYCHG